MQNDGVIELYEGEEVSFNVIPGVCPNVDQFV